MSVFTPFARQVLNQCDQLAMLTQTPGKVNRQYLTSQHAQANALLSKWMQEAGLKCWQDEVGNQWGRLLSSNEKAKTLIFGSHSDTVPDAGKYDGILGILVPLALARYCHENNVSLPFNLDIVAFGDEEGTRFGSTLMGSRAIAGNWLPKWATLKDNDGISLAQAMRDFGLDINQVHRATRSPEGILGFVELHIEQGPVLEAEALPAGIVSAIAGARRFLINVKGEAGHAGTVPMGMRKDAMCAAAHMILAIEELATQHQAVATVGQLTPAPNAVNVIAGDIDFTLDVRSQSDLCRDNLVEDILHSINGIADQRGVLTNIRQTHQAEAIQCDKGLTDLLARAMTQTGFADFQLPSGAGHDAMAMAQLCPVAMLFMRCERGISHHPDEAVSLDDVVVSLMILNQFLNQIPQHMTNASQPVESV